MHAMCMTQGRGCERARGARGRGGRERRGETREGGRKGGRRAGIRGWREGGCVHDARRSVRPVHGEGQGIA